MKSMDTGSTASPNAPVRAVIKAPLSLRAGLAGAYGAKLTLAAVITAGVAQVAPAMAQTVDEVTVTGTRPDRSVYADPVAPYKVDLLATSKFTEPLINVPKTVTVIPKEVIRDLGAYTFRDLMRTQPGVTLGTGEGGNAFGDRFFVRGFDTRNDVFVDGVRDPGVGSREVFAIEQVEVLKGPSSTFGGRGTTGAAISLVSKAPVASNFAQINSTVATDDTYRVTLDANQNFGDKFAVRLNAMYHESHVAGRDYVFNDRWGYAVAAEYRPFDGLKLSADYYHLNTDELPDWGFSYDLANNRPFQVRRQNFYGVLQRDYRDTWADIATLKGEWRVNEAIKLHSVLRYGQTLNSYIASAPEAPVTTNANPALWTLRANPKQRDAITTTLVNQSDVTLDFDAPGGKHTLVVGYELSREEVRNRQYANLNAELGGGVTVAPTTITQLINTPDPTQPWPFPKQITAIRKTSVNTTSLFALDTLKINEQWQVMGGVRWDQYEVKLFNNVLRPTPAQTLLTNKVDFTNFTVGLVYKPIENASVYLAYGSSSNPSGEQLDAAANDYGGLAANNAALDAEQNNAYELGAKWNVADGHLALTAALFRIDKRNARTQVGAGATLQVLPEGVLRVDGIELGATGNVTSKLSVFGGLTLLDAKTVKTPVAAQQGLGFPNISKTSFNLMTRYQATSRFYVGGQANYNSKKFGGTNVALATFVPGYWRFDAFAGYRVTDRIEVSVNVLNLTNKRYYDALYRSATPFVYQAPGRSAMLRLRLDL